MKIAVAGATGFVGSELVRSLNDRHETVSISRSKSRDADISVEADVSKKEEYVDELEDVEVAYYLVVLREISVRPRRPVQKGSGMHAVRPELIESSI